MVCDNEEIQMDKKKISVTLKSHRVDEFIRYLEDLRKRYGDELYLWSSDIELGSSIIVLGDNVEVYIHDDEGDELKEEEF